MVGDSIEISTLSELDFLVVFLDSIEEVLDSLKSKPCCSSNLLPFRTHR